MKNPMMLNCPPRRSPCNSETANPTIIESVSAPRKLSELVTIATCDRISVTTVMSPLT